MFGLSSFWIVYFVVNFIYVFILYKFFHNALINKVHKKSGFPIEAIEKAMYLVYIVNSFLGVLMIMFDIFQIIFDPKESFWLEMWNDRKK